jgi:hypothetical protein
VGTSHKTSNIINKRTTMGFTTAPLLLQKRVGGEPCWANLHKRCRRRRVPKPTPSTSANDDLTGLSSFAPYFTRCYFCKYTQSAQTRFPRHPPFFPPSTALTNNAAAYHQNTKKPRLKFSSMIHSRCELRENQVGPIFLFRHYCSIHLPPFPR